MFDQISKEEVFGRLEKKAGEYLKISNNCCQSTLLSLQEEFGLGNSLTVKAGTVFPGIALRGETCGAVIGCLMAISLVYGREDISDSDGYLRTLRPARKFCRLFEKEFSSVMCRHILKFLFGKDFDLATPEGAKEFQEAVDSYERSPCPPRKAVRIAAEIIMQKEYYYDIVKPSAVKP